MQVRFQLGLICRSDMYLPNLASVNTVLDTSFDLRGRPFEGTSSQSSFQGKLFAWEVDAEESGLEDHGAWDTAQDSSQTHITIRLTGRYENEHG